MTFSLILAFVVYFMLLLAIGIIFHKRQTSSAEFVMGNRSLNYWVVALSAHASDMSAWLFMAFPMVVFELGMSQIWMAVGLVVGMYLNWQLVAPPLRKLTEKYNCYTLPSFFEKRFNDNSGVLRILSAISTIIFLVHYLSSGMIGMGNLLESLFGIEYHVGLTIALLVAVIYTYLGGFATVAWTDFFQAIFLLLMIIIVPYLAYSNVGGWSVITEVAAKQGVSLSPWVDWNFESIEPLVMLAVGWGLGYFGMPHIVTKFMGLKNPSEMHRAKWVGITWQILSLLAAISVGIVGIAFYPNGIAQPEMIFIDMVKQLFHPFFGGIILCAIIAAIMSTMDSQILVCASILSEDLYRRFIPNALDKNVLRVSRLSVPIVTLVALILAANRSVTILDTVSYAWSGLGSAFGPIILTSLYSKRVNRAGAIAGIVVGTVVSMVWPTINPLITDRLWMATIPGFICGLTSIYVVSYFFPSREKSVSQEWT